MHKAEFIDRLRKALAVLPRYELEQQLSFYSEMIDDRVEEGLAEEEALAEIGPVERLSAQILQEFSYGGATGKNTGSARRLCAREIVLLVVGFPIWLPILAAGLAIGVSLFISVWAVLLSLWVTMAALATMGIYGFLAAMPVGLQSGVWPGMAIFGTGLACAGLAILLFFGCRALTAAFLQLTKWIFTVGRRNKQ